MTRPGDSSRRSPGSRWRLRPRRRRSPSRSPEVAAVGFGIPALVDWKTGVARWSTHLPLEEVPFRDLMSERLGLPVEVDNDSTAALIAEHRAGAARGARHAALITLGTGIGG